MIKRFGNPRSRSMITNVTAASASCVVLDLHLPKTGFVFLNNSTNCAAQYLSGINALHIFKFQVLNPRLNTNIFGFVVSELLFYCRGIKKKKKSKPDRNLRYITIPITSSTHAKKITMNFIYIQ